MPNIIFVHRGSQNYLKPILQQARRCNPGCSIILIGDELNRSHSNFYLKYDIEHVLIDEYSSSAELFAKIYRHDSSNPYAYELFCFQRWFVMHEFLKKRGFAGRVLYLDTDSVLYIDINDIFNVIGEKMTVCDKCGPQFTFFQSVDQLTAYCNFLTTCFEFEYESVLRFVKELNNIGVPHVSDMATLGLYNSRLNLFELSDISRKEFFFCENVSLSQGVELGFFGKRVIVSAGKRYFRRCNGELVRAGGVHLQGSAKMLWPFYVDKEVLMRNMSLDMVYGLLKGLIFSELRKFRLFRAINNIWKMV